MVYFKYFLMILSFIFLSGSSTCWSPMPVVSCGYRKPDIERYSKINTSLKQKEDDIRQCGGEIDKYGNIFASIRRANPGEENGWLAVKKFSNCMKNKGYYSVE